MTRPTARPALLALASLLPVALGAVTAARAGDPAATPPGEYRVAITDVTVIDVAAGTARPGTTVVVRGDRIAAVGPSAATPVPPGAAVVDGRGRYLIPGLCDMHAHLVHPALLDLYLRHGVTGVRHLFGVNPAYHPPRRVRPSGPVVPRVVAACQVLDGPDSGFGFPAGLNVFKVQTPASARDAVRRLEDQGNDFVKVYARLPREAYLAAVDEAKGLGLPVVGHLPYGVTAAEASDAGQLTIEHLDGVALDCSARGDRLTALLRAATRPGTKVAPTGGVRWELYAQAYETYDPDRAAALFAKFVANGTWHVPTLAQTRALTRLGDRNALPEHVRRQLPPLVAHYWEWESVGDGVRLTNLGLTLTRADLDNARKNFAGDLKLVGHMHRAGVPLLAGTDAPFPLVAPGLSLHEELALLVEAGLSTAEALRTATLNPARCLGREKDLGTVDAGKLADLVLLSGDPLADVRNTRTVAGVWVGGRPAVAADPVAGDVGPVATRGRGVSGPVGDAAPVRGPMPQ
jgi:imidazolonepropionase-like amidohydrolase